MNSEKPYLTAIEIISFFAFGDEHKIRDMKLAEKSFYQDNKIKEASRRLFDEALAGRVILRGKYDGSKNIEKVPEEFLLQDDIFVSSDNKLCVPRNTISLPNPEFPIQQQHLFMFEQAIGMAALSKDWADIRILRREWKGNTSIIKKKKSSPKQDAVRDWALLQGKMPPSLSKKVIKKIIEDIGAGAISKRTIELGLAAAKTKLNELK